MNQIKQELAASTGNFRQGYEDEAALLVMIVGGESNGTRDTEQIGCSIIAENVTARRVAVLPIYSPNHFDPTPFQRCYEEGRQMTGMRSKEFQGKLSRRPPFTSYTIMFPSARLLHDKTNTYVSPSAPPTVLPPNMRKT